MKKIFLPFTNRRFSHVAGNVDDAAKALQKSQKDKEAQKDAKDKEGDDGEAGADKDPKEGEDGATPEPEAQQNGDGQTPAPIEPAVTTPEPVVTPAPEEPVVKEEDIERAGLQLADNPHLIEPAKRTIAIAEGIIADRNKPAPLNDEEQALALHQQKVQLHGPDYVDAERMQGKQKQTRTFSRQTWATLGRDKSGWKEITKEMPEAKAAKQAAPPAPAKPEAGKKPPAKPTGKAGKTAGK